MRPGASIYLAQPVRSPVSKSPFVMYGRGGPALLILELIVVLELMVELVKLMLVMVEEDVEEGLLLALLEILLGPMSDKLDVLLVALAEGTVLESLTALLVDTAELNVDCGLLLGEEEELLEE
jgi:hypothetical protein